MITTVTKGDKQILIGKSNGICHANFMQNNKLVHTITLVSYVTTLKYTKLFLEE